MAKSKAKKNESAPGVNRKLPAEPMPEMTDVATTDRRDNDRRRFNDRRQQNLSVASDRRSDDRRQGERRRQIDPTTCERDYDVEELDFMQAMDRYKREFARPFPTWSEVLEVLKALGYRKVTEPSVIPLNRNHVVADEDAEDLDS